MPQERVRPSLNGLLGLASSLYKDPANALEMFACSQSATSTLEPEMGDGAAKVCETLSLVFLLCIKRMHAKGIFPFFSLHATGTQTLLPLPIWMIILQVEFNKTRKCFVFCFLNHNPTLCVNYTGMRIKNVIKKSKPQTITERKMFSYHSTLSINNLQYAHPLGPRRYAIDYIVPTCVGTRLYLFNFIFS